MLDLFLLYQHQTLIPESYFLTLTSFQPLYGKLSDIFGRKPCLLFAYTIFGLGCLFCGLARSLKELVAAIAFAGTSTVLFNPVHHEYTLNSKD